MVLGKPALYLKALIRRPNFIYLDAQTVNLTTYVCLKGQKLNQKTMYALPMSKLHFCLIGNNANRLYYNFLIFGDPQSMFMIREGFPVKLESNFRDCL